MAIGRLQQPLPRRSPRRIDWAHKRQPQDNDGDQCEHDAQHPLLARAACHPLHLQTFRHDRTVMSARVRPPGSWLDVAVIVKPADCSATSTILISSDFAAASFARSIPPGSRPMLIIDTTGAPCIAINRKGVRSGRSGSVRYDLSGLGILKKQKKTQ